MSNNLSPGDVLTSNQSRTSPDGANSLVMQQDGNLVLSTNGGANILWSSKTFGNDNASVCMQASDGNLVITTADGTVIWASDTGTHQSETNLGPGPIVNGPLEPGNPGAWGTVQDDGNFVLYAPGTVAIRASNDHK
jgi:hypothetical protein